MIFTQTFNIVLTWKTSGNHPGNTIHQMLNDSDEIKTERVPFLFFKKVTF